MLDLLRVKPAYVALAVSVVLAGGGARGIETGASPAPQPVTAKAVAADARPTLFLMGYAHLDTQWVWAYPKVIREFIPRTMHENFKLIEKYPDYIFNFTGANRYRMMREYHPADYARVKQYIAAERWFPAGASVEEADVNVPSAESLVRQILYGNEYFRTEFNTTPSVIARGYKMGVVGDSDNHEGLPGRRVQAALSPGHAAAPQGLTAVPAAALTRRDILRGYRSRATYATSGERIFLEVTRGGDASGPARDDTIQVQVNGTDVIESIRLWTGAGWISPSKSSRPNPAH